MRHKVADLDGPVHYIDFGGSGRPVVMVHGLGGSALNWMAVGPQIAESHRALALDLAGFGQTPLFGRAATLGANAVLVHEFVARVAGEPAILIGNSMGGHIAILESAAHPDSVRACVLVDPAIPGPYIRRFEPAVVGVVAAMSIPGLVETLLDRRSRALGPEGLVQRTLALVFADPSRVDPEMVEAHVQLTKERAHLGRQNTRAFVQASRSIGFRMADPRFWSRVAAVRAPTLVIHGSLDRLIPVSAAIELGRRRPDWELKILEGVGHVPMMETPTLFMEALEAWSPYRIASAAAV
ncbi:MAG TPA: alpha/beta fold hydrolase [Candidatus Dormibacteraeota bacterium]|nr:alpha/beta fold hydrolase [Candidatus Dormibacteraeota bacterium]